MLELVFLVVFCLLVAVQPTWSELRFEGAKVFRMKPNTEEQAVFIKHLAQKVMMDFWFPESVNQVAQGMTADIHIGGDSVLYVENHLKYSGIDHSIFIDNLQDQIKSQFDRVLRSAEVYDYEKYNDWDKIVSWTEHIAATFPSLVTRTEIGKTFEGNPIYLLKVGSRQDQSKPAVFMDCGIHAREWISPAFCQWFVKEATNTYGSDNLMTTLLDNLVFYVVPVLNVDGYIYTWTNDRLWRKNRSKHPSSSCLGVDLNRNFDAGWCKLGSSKNPCDETFCGSEVESELENEIAKGATHALASLYNTKYNYGPGATVLYPASGVSEDWSYDHGIKYSFTFELRDVGRHGFLLPESQIRPTCKETMLAIKYIAKYLLDHPY
ncbi:carboxypeptidase B-like isoform X3 [Acipenser ruthenus]|uniref:carboxypeptidase B-like isoform X3 n=1 Tax=Acipenser ruthenus TaxID=7906 RepID=UPI0027424221|nr:carboxypeptidase B-like isoform X3 [Acipenser ruthenus]